ncbi:MAG: zf-HC2 domain-containing protein [Acidobacteria bacterium]|nr:zf-HC2 domain-containing protein [Acidobacteriota bacterium]
MNCQLLRPHISAFLDNSLEPGLQQEVRAHLATCPSCREFQREQLQITDIFKNSAVELDPPDSLWREIQAHLQPPPPWYAFDWLFPTAYKYATVATLLLLVFSLVTFLGIRKQIETNRVLRQLQAYQFEPDTNLAWSALKHRNPFFEFDQISSKNPFLEGGNSDE